MLEHDPQSELQLSGGGALGQLRDYACLGVNGQGRIHTVGVDDKGAAPTLWRIPILDVEYIEGFGAELQAGALGQVNVLGQAEVHVDHM